MLIGAFWAQLGSIAPLIATLDAHAVITAAASWGTYSLNSSRLAADVCWPPVRELCPTAYSGKWARPASLGALRHHTDVLRTAGVRPAGCKVCPVS